MCYAQAEGGQRCYSHAKDKYQRALTNLRFGTDDARQAFIEAEVEFASTPQGEAELAAQYEAAAASGNAEAAADLMRSVDRGVDLRERNAAVKNAVRATVTRAETANALHTAPPSDIDAQLADLDEQEHQNQFNLDRAALRVRHAAGDTKTGPWGNQQWGMTFTAALAAAKAKAAAGGYRSGDAAAAVQALKDGLAERKRIEDTARPLNEEFERRGGWTRAFLVNNVGGHVHRDRNCTTCEPTTRYSWQHQYSGKSETEIVEAAGSSACTRCYPSAPAEVLNRPTQMVSADQAAAQTAREERAAAKIARDRAKIEKALTPDGSEFTVTYGEGRYDRERFKTEQAATSWAVGQIADYAEGGWRASNGRTMDPQMAVAVQTVKDAVALKHAMTPDEVEAHFAKKVTAKQKRDARG